MAHVTIPDPEAHARMLEAGLTRYALDVISASHARCVGEAESFLATVQQAWAMYAPYRAAMDALIPLEDCLPVHLVDLYAILTGDKLPQGSGPRTGKGSEVYPVCTWDKDAAQYQRWAAKISAAMAASK